MASPTSPPGDEAGQIALLLRSVTDYAIYMLDTQGNVVSWNPGGERIKGYRADEIIGSNFSRFYTSEDVAAGIPTRGLEVARAEGRFEAEGWRVRKDGTRFRASVVIDPVLEDGELVGYAKVTRDITERYEAEQELEQARKALLEAQKMEFIGKLTLGLAHDFNNLNTIMVNSLELIGARHPDDQRTVDLVDTAMAAAERAALLTRQLLAFGRGQSHAAERCDLNEKLGASMDLYRRACGRNIQLSLDASPGLPPVSVDVAQLEAAVLNLVANSCDAMPRGGHIVIRTGMEHAANPFVPGSQARDYVKVDVADDGEGIAPEDQRRAFEPFFTTKEVGKGSGLGLSQVFGFAAQSGGFANLASEPGRGTTVNICLPPAEVAA